MGQAVNAVWVDRITASDKISLIVQRRTRRRRLIDSLVLMVTLASMAVCISVYFRTRAELQAALSKHHTVAGRLEELQIKTDRLRNEVQRLRSDPKAIEAFARQNFGYIRSGEVVLSLPDFAEDGRRDKAQTQALQHSAESLGPADKRKDSL